MTALLSLVMIVKDEARSIKQVLEAAKPWIDRYDIVDTGSTDGTVEIINQTMIGVPGQVTIKPFVDFATTRNAALDIAETTGAMFSLQVSGDEYLHNGQSLRGFCEKIRDQQGTGHGMYHLKIHYDSLRFDSWRVVRNSAGWRWVGEVHEYMMKEGEPPPSISIPDAFLLHANSDLERKRLRLYKDLELLLEARKKDPKNVRTCFYLAQTFENLGMLRETHETYRQRAEMGGWPEEAYEAKYRMGRTGLWIGLSWPEIQQLFLESHTMDPRRAEPLYEIAKHYFLTKNYHLCWLFASRGAAMPYPDSILFVQSDVYNFALPNMAVMSAFFIGQHEAGEAIAKRMQLTNPHDARAAACVAMYEHQKQNPGAVFPFTANLPVGHIVRT